jgi:hypothetical protein
MLRDLTSLKFPSSCGSEFFHHHQNWAKPVASLWWTLSGACVEFQSLWFPEKNKFPRMDQHTELIYTMFGSYGLEFPSLGFSVLVSHFITRLIIVGNNTRLWVVIYCCSEIFKKSWKVVSLRGEGEWGRREYI